MVFLDNESDKYFLKMSFKKDLIRLVQPYYWVNLILSLAYIITKKTTPLCKILFPSKTECGELDMVRPGKSNLSINEYLLAPISCRKRVKSCSSYWLSLCWEPEKQAACPWSAIFRPVLSTRKAQISYCGSTRTPSLGLVMPCFSFVNILTRL